MIAKKARKKRIFSAEHRRKLKAAARKRAKHPMSGRKHSKKTRRQMAATWQKNYKAGKARIPTRKGQKLTAKHCKAIAAGQRRSGKGFNMSGKGHKRSSCKKISVGLLKYWAKVRAGIITR